MRGSQAAARALLKVGGVALMGAGAVMVAKGRAGRADIRCELAAQKITFPGAENLPTALAGHAGRRVETGGQARAYSDLIGAHVREATGGRTYSEISKEWMVNGRADEKLDELRQTAFMGQTLRGSLLSAYQAWQITSLVMCLGTLVSGLGVVLLAIDALLGPRRFRVRAR